MPGGPSGEVDFPDYMEEIHVDWLTGGTKGSPAPMLETTMEAVMNTALGGSPYSGEAAFDPGASFTPFAGSPLADMQSEHDSAETLIDGLDPAGASGDYFDAVTRAAALIDSTILTDSDISDAADAYEGRLLVRRRSEISGIASLYSDINAVHSSQFPMALALLEYQTNLEVNNFEEQLKIQTRIDKQKLTMAGVNTIAQLIQLKTSASLNLVQLQMEINRMEIVSKKEQAEQDLDIDINDALWDLQVFQFGGNLLASISGAARQTTEKPSKLQSAIGGGLSGAAAGFAVGGPWGAGVGFLAGTLYGLFS